jgi:YidC/Oxa1 family membrane protein insertase
MRKIGIFEISTGGHVRSDRHTTLSEFQNPQNQPGIDKRVIIVFAATMVLLVLAQQFLVKPQPQANQKQQTTASAPAAATPVPAGSLSAAPAAEASRPGAAMAAPAQATVMATSESTTVVENDLYRITFSNRGGLVKSWILKKYKDDSGQLGMELVHQQAASQYGYPLSLWTGNDQLSDKLNSALYVPSETGNVNTTNDLSFEYGEGDLVVKKEFHFDNSYTVGVKTSVRRGQSYATALPAWPSGFGDATGMPSYAEQRLDYVSTGEDVKRLKLDKKGSSISGGRVTTGNFQWVAASDAYFAAAFLPEQPQGASFAEIRNAIQIPKDPTNPQGEKVKAEVLGLAAGSLNAPTNVRLFAGPKAVDILETVHSANGVDLHGTLDFGFFGFIGRPLFAWVRWTQQHWTSNWGWTIILVTVLINAALLPLRISQIKSSMKMQKVAPQMTAIQEKYKKYKLDDPRRGEMQKEIAALYKEHDVNPVGGCVPLIIQMPFLFAFYTMLRNAIELRHASWLYLSDLSAPDHFHIIPIATIVLMFAMQRMMPATGMSKEQQRMMNMMTPVMIGLFTWSVASGLGLYIVTGTVVQIIQQVVMNQTPMGREMRAMAEKRALKAADKKR